MLALIRLTPQGIENLRGCLSNLLPGQQTWCHVLFWSAFILLFIVAGLMGREHDKNEKKLFTPSFVCFSLFTLLMCGSILVLSQVCS